jgi:PPP family 3-phenylpropionic acid transporter
LKGFYFLSYGALGSLFPFLPLLLSARGMSSREISFVMVLIPVSNLLVPPLWGGVADALRVRLPLLRAASAGSGLLSLLLLPAWGLTGTLAAMGAFSFFRAPITTLADAASVDALGGRNVDFGRIRIWGSLGFALFVSALGWLGASQRPTMLIAATCTIHLLSCASTLPLRSRQLRSAPHVLAQAGRILRSGPVLAFLGGNVFYYVGHSTYDAYFSLHARRLGFGDGFVGTAWSVGVGAEILVMLAAPRLLPRVRAGRWLAACSVVAVGRWMGLAHVTSWAALLGLQTTHGITFGLWYLSMVRFIQSRAPAHLRTSLQSAALSGVGLGMVGGYLAGGMLFDSNQGTTLYHAAAAAAAIALCCYLLAGALGPAPPPQALDTTVTD